MSRVATSGWGRPKTPEPVEERIVVGQDGTVWARSGKVEYGQDIRAGFARIVAREMGLPVARVQVELGETDRVPWDMGTYGSMSTATDGASLRAAAAYAMALLKERASVRFSVPVPDLAVQDGRIAAPDGQSVRYEQLVESGPLEGTVPSGSALEFASGAIDGGPFRVEAADIVTGRTRFPHDVRLPGMLRGHVQHPPVAGMHLDSFNSHAPYAQEGVVQIVHQGDFIGVLARRREQAVSAAQALDPHWSAGPSNPADPLDVTLHDDPDIRQELAAAAKHLASTYHVPHIAHASILPSAAVADVRPDGADLYVATQRPFGLRDEVAAIVGLRPEQVHVHPQHMSGMYGGGGWDLAALDAVRLSHAGRCPVLVEWTRAEEFALSAHRPVLDAQIAAGLSEDGQIVAWQYHCRTNPHIYGTAAVPPQAVAMTSGRNAMPPYALAHAEILLHVEPGDIRTSAFRSLAAAPNVFVIESFMDELAWMSGQDPIAFRLRHTDDPRLKTVLELVRERSGWNRSPREAGRGLGVACAVYHGTYIAEVARVFVAADGTPHLEQVYAAVDAGRLVHPDGARNQIEGGVQQAASWTLLEETQVEAGRVVTTNWKTYPIATFRDAPERIDVAFVASDKPSTGIGEPGSVPVAAAVANAVFAASGARVRQLPLRPAFIQKARAQA